MFKHNKGEDKFIYFNEDLLIDLCENCLTEYFANSLSDLQKNDEEYKMLMLEQENILEKCPNLRSIIEDCKVVKLTYKDVKNYIRFLDYKGQSDFIEQKEIFLKGVSIAYELFKKINVIK